MLELQASSSELNGQAVAERDQRISNLKKHLDKLKNENSKSAGRIMAHTVFISFTFILSR